MKKTTERNPRRKVRKGKREVGVGGGSGGKSIQLISLSTEKEILDTMSALYLSAIGIHTILSDLKERGLTISLCLFPHGNSDVSIKDTEVVIRLLERSLPLFVEHYLYLLKLVTNEAVRLWSSVEGEESYKEMADLMEAIRWGSKVVLNVLIYMLMQSDSLVERVMQSEAMQKLMANVPVVPPTPGGNERKGQAGGGNTPTREIQPN